MLANKCKMVHNFHINANDQKINAKNGSSLRGATTSTPSGGKPPSPPSPFSLLFATHAGIMVPPPPTHRHTGVAGRHGSACPCCCCKRTGGVYDCNADCPCCLLCSASCLAAVCCYCVCRVALALLLAVIVRLRAGALALLLAVVTKGDACFLSPPRRVQRWSSLDDELLLPASPLTRNTRNASWQRTFRGGVDEPALF